MKSPISRATAAAALAWGALVACGENHEVLGSRSAGAGNGGSTSGSGPASGGAGAVAGARSGSSGAAGSGGTPAGAGSGALSGSSGTTGSGGPTGGASTAGGASGRGGGVGSGGSSNAGAPNAGQSTAGLAGEGGGGVGNAGAGNAGAAGADTCPAGCVDTMPVNCPDGQVGWTCSSGYDSQAFLNSGCTDLATDIQRFCCPVNFFTGCKPCADVSTLDECETRIDCHSVFVDPGTCGCAAAGCCAHFSRCADGAWATCNDASINCDVATPHCETPYVVSYADGCYEGCVASKDCPVQ